MLISILAYMDLLADWLVNESVMWVFLMLFFKYQIGAFSRYFSSVVLFENNRYLIKYIIKKTELVIKFQYFDNTTRVNIFIKQIKI